MVNILFWNLHRKPLQNHLAGLVKAYPIDLLILAENVLPLPTILTALNGERPGYKMRPWSICNKITVFTRFHADFLKPEVEDERFLICSLNLPARTEALLAMAHLSSKMHSDDHDQLARCQLLSKGVNDAEEKVGHRRTILVGDLNVNPFEAPVASAIGLHAVMSRQVATKNTRKIQDKEYRFFYNPMWRHFGEHLDGPPGTYYYASSRHVTYFWNIFDQVLVRADLIRNFPDRELRILTSIGEINLLGANGLPNKETSSDHLPMI